MVDPQHQWPQYSQERQPNSLKLGGPRRVVVSDDDHSEIVAGSFASGRQPNVRLNGAQSAAAPAESWAPSLHDLVGASQHGSANGQPEGLGGLEVDRQLEFCGLLDGKVTGPGALEDLVHVRGGATEDVHPIDAIRHERAIAREHAVTVHGGNSLPERELGESTAVSLEEPALAQDNRIRALLPYGGEGLVQPLRSCDLHRHERQG